LQITNEVLEETNEQSDEEMSVVPVPATVNNNKQAVMPKNTVPDLEWFNGDRMKFKNW